MHRPLSESEAARRSRWLADLLTAIDDAQRVAWRLSSEGANPEALELYERLELARAEVESLRASGWADRRQKVPSQWMGFLADSLRPLGTG